MKYSDKREYPIFDYEKILFDALMNCSLEMNNCANDLQLFISLRTAWANELSLDKEQTSYSDSIDALRLACKMYKMN